jgi:hypothetical protein
VTAVAGAPSLAVRLDYGDPLVDAPSAARTVAEVLVRPCFSELSRLSARCKDRWSKHAKPSVDLIAEYLADAAHDAISLDTKRGGELVASGEIENGVGRDQAPVFATRLQAYVAIPLVAADLDATLVGVRDLAAALHAATGFVTLEPSYGLSHRAAVAASRPKERMGLSEHRFRERSALLGSGRSSLASSGARFSGPATWPSSTSPRCGGRARSRGSSR